MQGGEEERLCSVCLDAGGEGLVTTPCGHPFHERCLLAWRRASVRYSCPNCRTALLPSGRRGHARVLLDMNQILVESAPFYDMDVPCLARMSDRMGGGRVIDRPNPHFFVSVSGTRQAEDVLDRVRVVHLDRVTIRTWSVTFEEKA